MALSRPALMLVLATTIGCNGIIGGADGTDGGGPFGGPGSGGPNVAGAVAPNVMHRLNREEYSNTVRDLLQTSLDPAADFPADDVSLGFDNIAQVLSVSPLQFELYEQAAEALAQEVLSGPARGAVVFCDAEESACRDEVLRTLARRAWRRPVTDAEVARLQQLVDVALAEGESVDQGLNLAIRGVLLSPHFVYRPELDDASSASTPRLLNDYELASRLSYFLWSSMPDEALFEAAAAGRLSDDGGIAAEVDRMLADPKADALLDNFAGQWLRIRSLDDHSPDYATFPTWNDGLRNAMREEARLFFREFLRGDMPMDELLVADFTYVNDALAAHYGLDVAVGPELERVALGPMDTRFGLLTLGSLLTVTSTPTRTSPVKRGVWILEQLLCSEPEPPPPGVEGFPEDDMTTQSLREQLEAHRANPTCASCHNVMDPLGLGLEAYDAIGTFRTEDRGFPIDASSELVTGEAFDDARGMADLVQSDPRFGHCVAEQLFTYALGRPAGSDEGPFLDEITERFNAAGASFPELIKLIATSEPFRSRRGIMEASQ